MQSAHLNKSGLTLFHYVKKEMGVITIRKILNSFTFLFGVFSVLIIVMNLIGLDNNFVILTLSNYPLYVFLNAIGFKIYLPNAIEHTFYINQTFLWFRLHFYSYLCYGIVFDIIRFILKNRKTN